MNSIFYLSVTGALGGVIGWAMAPAVGRIPGRIYRGWVQECVDVLGQADQLDDVAELTADQAARAKSIGGELQAAISLPRPAPSSLKRSAVLAGTLGTLFAAIAWSMPAGTAAAAWMFFAAWAVLMSAVDWESTLLPDVMTIPLIWAGLIASWAGWIDLPLQDGVAGAVAGYAVLRVMHEGNKAITGQEGMGHGDFKLLSAIGAWLGWQALLPVLIVASLSGLVASGVTKLANRQREGGIIPFGPFLVAGAMVVAITGVAWPLRPA